MEWHALSAFNALHSDICAVQVPADAGAPPLQLVGIPLSTFIDTQAPSVSGTRAKLKDLIAQAFGERVILSDVRTLGRGLRYGFTALGPSKNMGISAGTGYWYQANFALWLETDATGEELSEEMMIMPLELIEIRAPENLATLPDDLIRSGKELEYYDSARVRCP